MQAGKGGKGVSDQWLDPFVIVDEEDHPVGTVEVRPKASFQLSRGVSVGFSVGIPIDLVASLKYLCIPAERFLHWIPSLICDAGRGCCRPLQLQS